MWGWQKEMVPKPGAHVVVHGARVAAKQVKMGEAWVPVEGDDRCAESTMRIAVQWAGDDAVVSSLF